jgi:hypothetical protein
MLVQLISSFGTFGFVLWLVHRTTTVTIPRLARENAERQTEQRSDFLEAQRVSREDFRAALLEQREAFRGELEREREVHGEHMGSLVEAIREARDRSLQPDMRSAR